MSYCDWDKASDMCKRYHDEEWGVPLRDDVKQFEFLMMEVMQCGLNWNMMIAKREIFRACFAGFDFGKVALFGEKDIEKILAVPGMIRSRRKIEAVINNARRFIEIRREFGTFSHYLWGFAGGKPLLYNRHEEGYIPVSNGLSDRISADLKKRGFRFLGSVTVYSHLQACGIINDPDKNCPRYKEITENHPPVRKRRDKEKNITYYG